jgi:hypothetical protein
MLACPESFRGRDAIMPRTSAESALQPGWKIEMASKVKRAFSAGEFFFIS